MLPVQNAGKQNGSFEKKQEKNQKYWDKNFCPII